MPRGSPVTDTLDALGRVPLFAQLGPDELEAIVASGEARRVEAGEVVFRRGDAADGLLVVLEGELRIFNADENADETNAEVELGRAGPGEYVGEIALLDGGLRSASVAASQSSELFVLQRSAFLHLLESRAGVLATVLGNVLRLVREHPQRLLDQQRQQRELRLEMELARHRALTQLVAGVAHEITTPLGIVNTAASLVAERVGSGLFQSLATSPEARTVVDDLQLATGMIERNIQRAHRLIQDFKKLSVSQVSDELAEMDVVSTVDEIVGLYRISARRAGLRITVHDRLADPLDRRWVGYHGYLSQVLLNLLTNIERYAYPPGAGGEVDVGIDVQPEPAVRPLVITVRDFGRGIPPENVERAFEPFFTTGRASGGSGLGLAVVRSLVTDGMGGQVELSSRVGEGTTVTVRLPRRIEPIPGASLQ
jgi:signal transduction histidine kinase